MNRHLPLVVLLLLSPIASAVDFASPDVLVPIVARTPGAFGTFWQTDVTITSLATEPVTSPVAITLTNDFGDFAFDQRIDPGETIVLADIMKTAFSREQGFGALRVSSPSNVLLLVRARIYTTHPTAGEFGQIVQGLPIESLATQVDLSGFTVRTGARMNIGIASPVAATTARLWLRDRFGVNIGEPLDVAVPRGGVVQINDIIRRFRTEELEGGSVHVTATQPVYAYASVVRNDSGDPLFIIGTRSPMPDDSALPVACANPAELRLAPLSERGWGWLVMFKEGTDTTAATKALEAKYGFTAEAVYPSIRVFYAELRKEAVAALRCESAVLLIEQNAIGEVTSRRSADR